MILTEEEEENERLRLYKKGLNDREIGDKLGLTRTSICTWRQRRNLLTKQTPPYYQIKEDEENTRIRLYKEGLIDKEIGKILDRKTNSICTWRQRRNLPRNKSCNIPASREYKRVKDGIRENFEIRCVKDLAKCKMLAKQFKKDEPELYDDCEIDEIIDKWSD